MSPGRTAHSAYLQCAAEDPSHAMFLTTALLKGLTGLAQGYIACMHVPRHQGADRRPCRTMLP